jgi:hypothetical protein
MRNIVIGVAALLSGCATTPEGIQKEKVDLAYTSTKEPMAVARCLKDLMPAVDVYPGNDYVSVSNKNQFGSILINWLIRETPTGSTIEVRRTNSIAPGIALATRCY